MGQHPSSSITQVEWDKDVPRLLRTWKLINPKHGDSLLEPNKDLQNLTVQVEACIYQMVTVWTLNLDWEKVHNYAEFMALRFHLQCALEKNVKHLRIFGDSSLVVNWMKGIIQLSNITLKIIGDQLKEVANFFESITFTHIYRELNVEVDACQSRHSRYLKVPRSRWNSRMALLPSIQLDSELSLMLW